MSDDTEPTPTTDEQPTPTKHPERTHDRRSLAIGAGGVLALLLTFGIGFAAGSHHDSHGEHMRFGAMQARGGDWRGPDARGGGMDGPRGGGMGMRIEKSFSAPDGSMPGAPGEGPGRMEIHRGGGVMGVVTKVADDQLTVEGFGPNDRKVKVKLTKSTNYLTSGLDDAKRSDIDVNDVVAVRSDNGDGADEKATSVDADAIVILHDAS